MPFQNGFYKVTASKEDTAKQVNGIEQNVVIATSIQPSNGIQDLSSPRPKIKRRRRMLPTKRNKKKSSPILIKVPGKPEKNRNQTGDQIQNLLGERNHHVQPNSYSNVARVLSPTYQQPTMSFHHQTMKHNPSTQKSRRIYTAETGIDKYENPGIRNLSDLTLPPSSPYQRSNTASSRPSSLLHHPSSSTQTNNYHKDPSMASILNGNTEYIPARHPCLTPNSASDLSQYAQKRGNLAVKSRKSLINHFDYARGIGMQQMKNIECKDSKVVLGGNSVIVTNIEPGSNNSSIEHILPPSNTQHNPYISRLSEKWQSDYQNKGAYYENIPHIHEIHDSDVDKCNDQNDGQDLIGNHTPLRIDRNKEQSEETTATTESDEPNLLENSPEFDRSNNTSCNRNNYGRLNELADAVCKLQEEPMRMETKTIDHMNDDTVDIVAESKGLKGGVHDSILNENLENMTLKKFFNGDKNINNIEMNASEEIPRVHPCHTTALINYQKNSSQIQNTLHEIDQPLNSKFSPNILKIINDHNIVVKNAYDEIQMISQQQENLRSHAKERKQIDKKDDKNETLNSKQEFDDTKMKLQPIPDNSPTKEKSPIQQLYVEEIAWRTHNDTFRHCFPKYAFKELYDLEKKDPSKIIQNRYSRADRIRSLENIKPLPPAPPLPVHNFPRTGYCSWSFDDSARVIHADFSPKSYPFQVIVTNEDENFLLLMMERDDVTVISSGLVNSINPQLWDQDYITSYAGDDVYHRFRSFKRVLKKREKNDGEGMWISHTEKDKWTRLRVRDFFRYLTQRKDALEKIRQRRVADNIHAVDIKDRKEDKKYRKPEEEIFEYEDPLMAKDDPKKLQSINCIDEVLYMIDYDIGKLLPKLKDDFVENFTLKNILPGGLHCMMNSVNVEARPFMGPNLYLTPPASFTHFHQDGHGTVDSGHACLSGYNEVVMLRRLTESHKRHALFLLNGGSIQTLERPNEKSVFDYDALYGRPHDDGYVS